MHYTECKSTRGCCECVASAYAVAMTTSRLSKKAKVIPITEEKRKLTATDEKTKRFILAIGNQRVAFDFSTCITKLPQGTGSQPARVLSMDQRPTSKRI